MLVVLTETYCNKVNILQCVYHVANYDKTENRFTTKNLT